MSKQTIKCPNCGTQIDIDEIFYHQIEEKFKQEHLAKEKQLREEIEAKRKEYKDHLDELKRREEEFKSEQERFEDKLKDATQKQLRLEKEKLREALKAEAVAEQGAVIETLKKEIEAKSKEVVELNNAKAEIERLKRANDEAVSKAKVEAEIELSKQLQAEKEKIQKEALLSNELKLKEKDKQLEDQKRLIEEMKRKSEQGSMQLQGEVQELVIEEWLSAQFPFDSISEVKKGAFGADCVQVVNTRELHNCGVICYESKNAKAWSDGWIAKFKQDMLKANADIGVFVTSVYPNGMERMGFVEGVWVCSLEEFKGSAALLRESLITTHKAVQKDENRGDKMSLLYNYLTSNEFAMQMQAIVDGFITMQDELEREKRSLSASWKRRQKLIDGVLTNTTEMYGSLQGIAGNALAHIKSLELPYLDEDEES
ncbi:MAG: DUF2130 domain-containing protein [Sulfurovaceae bacterium]